MVLASLGRVGPLVAAGALIRASGLTRPAGALPAGPPLAGSALAGPPLAGGLMLAWGLALACGPAAVAGVTALLNGALSCAEICASGAVPDGAVEGCGLPEDEGDGDGPGDAGSLEWSLPPPDGALGA